MRHAHRPVPEQSTILGSLNPTYSSWVFEDITSRDVYFFFSSLCSLACIGYLGV
ncbi:unnamed protein product [Penicillium nalgiovense]|nr:unnamed protein product [Penicillium nalgiovense]